MVVRNSQFAQRHGVQSYGLSIAASVVVARRNVTTCSQEQRRIELPKAPPQPICQLERQAIGRRRSHSRGYGTFILTAALSVNRWVAWVARI